MTELSKDLQEYKNLVEELYESRSSKVFENSSFQHANIVLQTMISGAEKNFYVIDKDLNGTIAQSIPQNDTFYSKLVIFLLFDKKMQIVTTDQKYEEGNFFKFIMGLPNKLKNNLEVYFTPKAAKEKVTKFYTQFNDNNAVRVTEEETSIAKCSFNDEKAVNFFLSKFETLKELPETIKVNI